MSGAAGLAGVRRQARGGRVQSTDDPMKATHNLRKIGVGVICLVVCINVACSRSRTPPVASVPDADSLVGRWTELNGPDRIEFQKSGNYSATFQAGTGAPDARQISGIYLQAGAAVNLMRPPEPPLTLTYRIANGGLSIAFVHGAEIKRDGTVETFSRD